MDAGTTQTAPRGRGVRLEFGHDAGVARRARQFVGAVLGDDALTEDVRLVVSELVTNAVAHTDDGGVLRMFDERPAGPVRVEVEDGGIDAPKVHTVERELGGKGLQIVERLAERWGVRRTRHGKVVWAELV